MKQSKGIFVLVMILAMLLMAGCSGPTQEQWHMQQQAQNMPMHRENPQSDYQGRMPGPN